MYKCKYFKIKELVHPDLLQTIDEETLWKIFDPNLLKMADFFREKYGPIFINGNGLVNCGLRKIDSDVGAKYSPHKYGRALDLHIVSIEKQNLSKEEKINKYNEVRKSYLQKIFLFTSMDEKEYNVFKSINFEDNISWLHIDTFNRPRNVFNA